MTTTKVLAALDALDRYSFDRMDATNSLDTLYAKIFTSPTRDATGSSPGGTAGVVVLPSSSSTTPNHPSSDSAGLQAANNGLGNTSGTGGPAKVGEYSPQQDAPIVEILCEWAVSAERWGEHRAMAVAKLLEKRQSEATGESGDACDDKDSVCSNGNGPPVFQQLLMKFLDCDAPVLDNGGGGSCSPQHSKVQFTNLVHLFSELIRHDVFSHDAYLRTLISRGDLIQGTVPLSFVCARW